MYRLGMGSLTLTTPRRAGGAAQSYGAGGVVVQAGRAKQASRRANLSPPLARAGIASVRRTRGSYISLPPARKQRETPFFERPAHEQRLVVVLGPYHYLAPVSAERVVCPLTRTRSPTGEVGECLGWISWTSRVRWSTSTRPPVA